MTGTTVTSTSDTFHEYDAATAPQGFWVHAWPVFSFLARAWRSRELVQNFYQRDLMARFRGSAGGFGWVLVQPIFQFCVYFLVFGVLFGNTKELVNSGPDPFFAVYLFAGIITFNVVQEGASNGLNAVTANANLVKKVAFPCELLPIVPVLIGGTIFAVASVVLLLIGLVTGEVVLSWSLLLWPVSFVCLITFVSGLVLFLSGANVFTRDVQMLWGILSLAWFFTSPVFWRVELLRGLFSDLGQPWMIHLLLLNPMYPILMAQRQVFGIGAHFTPEKYELNFPLPLEAHLAVAAVWAFIMLFIGHGFFMSRRRKFADLV